MRDGHILRMDAILAASSLSGGSSSKPFPLKLLADTQYSQSASAQLGAGGCYWSFSHYGSSTDSNIFEFINPVLKLTRVSDGVAISGGTAQIYATTKDHRSDYSSLHLPLKINSFLTMKTVSFNSFFAVARSCYAGNDQLQIRLEARLSHNGTGNEYVYYLFSSKMRVWGASQALSLL